MTDYVDEFLVDVDQADLAAQGTAAAAAEVTNLFPNVAAFVSGFLVAAYARPVGAQVTGFRWCSRWWEHAEAVARLEALWKAFETLRQDPGTGAAVWWRDYADPTMAALCAPDGAFKQCSDTQHKVQPDLPTIPPPDFFTTAQ